MRRAIISLTCLLALGAEARAQTPPALAPIEARMAAAIAANEATSLSIAVIQDNQIVWTHSAGWADVAAQRPATPDTIYRIGSVSKSITATVLMIAAKHGRIDLDRTAGAYLPQLARTDARLGRARLADILNMAAGMPQAVYYSGISADILRITPDQFFARHVMSVSDGAARYAYSNLGPEIGARALARTGAPFAEQARELLFAPLGAEATFFSFAEAPAARRATSYTSRGEPYRQEFEALPAAGAGAVASVNDVARYALLHLTGRTSDGRALLNADDLRVLHSGPTMGLYGYGWARIGAGTPFEALLSDGQVNGGQAIVLLAPQERAAIVVLSNQATNAVNAVAFAAMEAVAPGFGAAFEQNVAILERGLEQSRAALLPPPSFTLTGAIEADGRRDRFEAEVLDGQMSLRLRGAVLATTPLPADEGFARWEIPCAALQACAVANARATLHVTRDGEGYGAMIVVSNDVGLFPYRLELRGG